MQLDQFVAKNVSPGEPVTAQAWNDIVNTIAALLQHLRDSEAASLRVTITNADLDPAAVRVTAVRDDGLSAEAVAPVSHLSEDYVFSALKPGAYKVRAEAAGFSPATEQTVIPTRETLSITLAPSAAFMPQVLGQELQVALKQLKTQDVTVSRILDVVGRDVAPANPSAAHNSSPVLTQFPAPGEAVPPEGSAQLVIAAALQVEPTIEMPSLTGLTLAEAQKALGSLGLPIGKVVTKERQ